MTDLIHADHHVSRCGQCGAWQWMGLCATCERRLFPVEREAA